MKYKILSFALIMIALFMSYFVYLNLPGEVRPLSVTDYNMLDDVEGVSSEVKQFVPNMRFNHNQLTYSIDENCEIQKQQRMKQAFDILESETQHISFFPQQENPDIIIACSKEAMQKSAHTFIAGEGGPSKFLNLSLYPLILEGQILLYEDLYDVECEKPVVEIHELLHVFGFDHIDDKSSVLYPYFSCDQELNQDIIDSINTLYSIQPKAELFFQNITATKSGRYLNFEAVVENQGLIPAENIELIILEKDKEVKTFDMKELKMGSYQKLEVENLRLNSRSSEEVEFKITSSTSEFDLENNKIKLTISE